MTSAKDVFWFGFAFATGCLSAYTIYALAGVIAKVVVCAVLRKFGYEVVEK